jgi:hypothetical protein
VKNFDLGEAKVNHIVERRSKPHLWRTSSSLYTL